jgi:hypothetical protein
MAEIAGLLRLEIPTNWLQCTIIGLHTNTFLDHHNQRSDLKFQIFSHPASTSLLVETVSLPRAEIPTALAPAVVHHYWVTHDYSPQSSVHSLLF